MSLSDIINSVGITLRPDLIVGCRYLFCTKLGVRNVVVEGIITNFRTKDDVGFRYYVTGNISDKIAVTELVRQNNNWLLLVRSSGNATMFLEGNLYLI